LALGYLIVLGGSYLQGHFLTDRQGRRLEDEAAMTRVRESLEDALLKPL